MERVKRASSLALDLFGACFNALGGVRIPATKRSALAVTLMRSSLDHGRAASLLIASEPSEFGIPALALHRTQIDTLLRGAFFAQEATDAELDYFIDEQEMPVRENKEGKSKRLSPKDLAGFPQVAHALGADELSKISSYLDNSWGALCGYVHGGMETVLAYHKPEVAFDPEPGDVVEICTNIAALGNLAMIGIFGVAGIGRNEVSDKLQGPWNGMSKYLDYVKEAFPPKVAPEEAGS